MQLFPDTFVHTSVKPTMNTDDVVGTAERGIGTQTRKWFLRLVHSVSKTALL